MNDLAAIEGVLSHLELGTRPPTLEHMQKALSRIGYEDSPWFKNPRFGQVIVVAGTNGKGSTCATLAHLLKCAGVRVGLFTSPHLERITERIQVAGQEISEQMFMESFYWVWPQVHHLPLTRFEVLTLMAIDVFALGRLCEPVDRMILEVGVGGRFDASNAIAHDFAILSRLGMDHMKMLGSTLTEIAENKMGVVSPGCTVVHAPLAAELESLKALVQAETNSHWIESVTGTYHVVEGGETPQFEVITPWGPAELALAGARGAENTCLALSAFKELGFDPARHLSDLKNVVWPGRMELVATSPCPVYLSGDHNEQGMASLVEILEHFRYRKLHVMMGLGAEKNPEDMLRPWQNVPRYSLYLTETPFKGQRLQGYGAQLERAAAYDADPRRLYQEMVQQARAGDLIVITGSLYLIGEMRGWLRKQDNENRNSEYKHI